MKGTAVDALQLIGFGEGGWGFDLVRALAMTVCVAASGYFTACVLGAIAAVTERITLGTAALVGPLRHPLLTAAQAATVDQLSGGRLILGLGSGAPTPESRAEFEALATPFGDRARRLDETVALCRRAWTTGGGFSGSIWQIDDLGGALPPARPGGPPLWLAGGDTERVIKEEDTEAEQAASTQRSKSHGND